jgi:Lrp/AsnC family leucine-responsive transcriptional regulator
MKNLRKRTNKSEEMTARKKASHAAGVAPVELEASDRRILRALQADGRLSNTVLARRVNLSQSACWTRTKRLFTAGIIRAVRAVIDPGAVGQETLVLIGVVLDRSTPESFAAFEAAVRQLPQVLECHLVAGEFDYFLKVRVRDLAGFNRFHSERIISLPGVRQVRTFFVLDEIKADGLLPI